MAAGVFPIGIDGHPRAGADPCPHLADHSTEPADLYESAFSDQFTS